jgi:hypothetical protein
MLQLTAPPPRSRRKSSKTTRPSLVDLRFKGDAWVVPHDDDTASVCLGNFSLLRVNVSPFDLPSLNRTFQQVRFGEARRRAGRCVNEL